MITHQTAKTNGYKLLLLKNFLALSYEHGASRSHDVHGSSCNIFVANSILAITPTSSRTLGIAHNMDKLNIIVYTVFTVATINFIPASVCLLIEGGSYSNSRVAKITQTHVNAISRQYIGKYSILLFEGSSYVFVFVIPTAIIRGRLLFDVRLLFESSTECKPLACHKSTIKRYTYTTMLKYIFRVHTFMAILH